LYAFDNASSCQPWVFVTVRSQEGSVCNGASDQRSVAGLSRRLFVGPTLGREPNPSNERPRDGECGSGDLGGADVPVVTQLKVRLFVLDNHAPLVGS
jgi:hypothetical protein